MTKKIPLPIIYLLKKIRHVSDENFCHQEIKWNERKTRRGSLHHNINNNGQHCYHNNSFHDLSNHCTALPFRNIFSCLELDYETTIYRIWNLNDAIFIRKFKVVYILIENFIQPSNELNQDGLNWTKMNWIRLKSTKTDRVNWNEPK